MISGAIQNAIVYFNKGIKQKLFILVIFHSFYFASISYSYSNESIDISKENQAVVSLLNQGSDLLEAMVGVANEADFLDYQFKVDKYYSDVGNAVSDKIRSLNFELGRIEKSIKRTRNPFLKEALEKQHKETIDYLGKLSANQLAHKAIKNTGRVLDAASLAISSVELMNDINNDRVTYHKSVFPVLADLIPYAVGATAVLKGATLHSTAFGGYAGAGAVLLIAADSVLDSQREYGDVYRDRFWGLRDEYFSQYNALAKIGLDEGLDRAYEIESYYRKRRREIVSELISLENELKTIRGGLPFFGKGDLLELVGDLYTLLDQNENEITARQRDFVSNYIDANIIDYYNNVEYKNSEYVIFNSELSDGIDSEKYKIANEKSSEFRINYIISREDRSSNSSNSEVISEDTDGISNNPPNEEPAQEVVITPLNGEPAQTGPTAEELQRQREQDEADRQARIQAAIDAENARVAEVNSLIGELDRLYILKGDLDGRIQNAENKFTVLESNDLEQVQNRLRVVNARIEELRGKAISPVEIENLESRQTKIAGDIDDLGNIIKFRDEIYNPTTITQAQKDRLNQVAWSLGVSANSGEERWKKLFDIADTLLADRERVLADIQNQLATAQTNDLDTLLREQADLQAQQDRIARDIRETRELLSDYQNRLSSTEYSIDLKLGRLSVIDPNRNYIPPIFSADGIKDWSNYTAQNQLEIPNYSFADESDSAGVEDDTDDLGIPVSDTDDLSNENTVELAASAETESDPVIDSTLQNDTSKFSFATGGYVVQDYFDVGYFDSSFYSLSRNYALSDGNQIKAVHFQGDEQEVQISTENQLSSGYQDVFWGTDPRRVMVNNSIPSENTFWLYGNKTPVPILEARTGTANFSGELVGHFASGDDNRMYFNSVTGDLNFEVDFAGDTVTGSGGISVALPSETKTKNFTLEGSFSAYGEAQPSISGGESDYSYDYSVDNNIVAELTSQNGGGYIGGNFAGDTGREFGGVFGLLEPDEYAFGIVTARNTSGVTGSPGDTTGVGAGDGTTGDSSGGATDGTSSNTTAFISTQSASNTVSSSRGAIDRIPIQDDTLATVTIPPLDGGGTVSTTQVLDVAEYNHTQWGRWGSNTDTPSAFSSGGYFVAGNLTPSSVVENRTGTASYSGGIIGDFVSGVGSRSSATGTINLEANFTNQNITGQMHFAHGGMNSPSATLNSNITNGSFSQTSANHGFSGAFFGPNAEEVGGAAWMNANGGAYNGVFRAQDANSSGAPSAGGVAGAGNSGNSF